MEEQKALYSLIMDYWPHIKKWCVQDMTGKWELFISESDAISKKYSGAEHRLVRKLMAAFADYLEEKSHEE